MLKKQFRLPARIRLADPSIVSTPFFIIRIAQNGMDYNRYGFVVPKKVDKRAVIRNTIKRRIRNCIEEMEKNLQKGNDMLFFLKKEAINQERAVFYEVLEKQLKTKGILRI